MTKTAFAYVIPAFAALVACAQQPAAKPTLSAFMLGGHAYTVSLAGETPQLRAAHSVAIASAPALPTDATSTGPAQPANLKQ